jgi:hypothetical protein
MIRALTGIMRVTQIDSFMGEIRLMSMLDHERIVRFIGVAWNSLSDACAVVEYMEYDRIECLKSV